MWTGHSVTVQITDTKEKSVEPTWFSVAVASKSRTQDNSVILRLSPRWGQWIRVGTYGDDQIVHAVPFQVLALDLLVLWGEERLFIGTL